MYRHGLTIGDIDNDDNELVFGTAEGELYIFKVNIMVILFKILCFIVICVIFILVWQGSELWQKINKSWSYN